MAIIGAVAGDDPDGAAKVGRFQRGPMIRPREPTAQSEVLLDDTSAEGHGSDGRREADCVVRKAHEGPKLASVLRDDADIRVHRSLWVRRGTLKNDELAVASPFHRPDGLFDLFHRPHPGRYEHGSVESRDETKEG